ncbi:YbiU family protein [Amycolatopsis nigrescens]|uniref:YbiU family protein n=1 Tax=Amycolatopsis nigrescens TaxID=381445 RepID=UPI00037AFA98|nr:YbiU family protein [Amycolatopsis nigrescens]
MSAGIATSELPGDVPAAIAEAKELLRGRLGDVAGVFAEVEAAMRAEVAEVVAEREAGREVFPVVRYADLADGRVPEATVAAIRRRGCAVVKGTFPRERAEAWDAELAAYLERNGFAENYRGLVDGAFGGLSSGRPQIYPVYWSKPQIEARQDERMAVVRSFLNSFWRNESEGRTWFDPDRDTAYPDRIRRREPGSESLGLSAHTDSGSIERWLLPAYQKVFRHVFSGQWRDYDPWDGAYRTEVDEFPSTVMCSSFRTFQGWTALSEMRPADGVLHVVPIPSAMAYVLLRALQDDVPADDLCGAANGQALPITERYHSVLLPALSPIPVVEPGDTVWWHGDVIHSVADGANPDRWGNVMYIPASPHCAKNAAYAEACGQAFTQGASPADFAPEDYEAGWTGRAEVADLNDIGRQQLGIATA